MHRLLSSLLYTLTALGLLAQCGHASPDFTLYEAKDDCGFSKPDPVGTYRYGYTLYPSDSDRHPNYRYWCKPIKQGKTHVWHDENGNQAKDSGEVKDCNYYIWYTLEIYTDCGSYSQSMIGPDGKIEKEIQYWRQIYSDNGLASVNVGDVAGAKDGICKFLRGPYSAYITVKPQMEINGSGYGVSEKTYIPPSFEDADSIAQECNEVCKGRTDEAVRLAKEMCARWEETYKYANSLTRDVRPFILRKDDIPKDLSIDISLPAKDEPSTCALVYYNQPDGHFYGLDINAYTMDSSVSYNGALAYTKECYDKEVGKLKRPEAIAIPGAEEAVRMLYRNTGNNNEVICFRVKNIWVKVWGSISGKSLAPTRAATLAKAVCAKITGAPSTSIDVDGAQFVELNAEPASIWADGTSKVKLILTAKDSAGKPIANASFDIEMESNLLGKCKDVKMITDSSGRAAAFYVPTKAGSNTISVKGDAGSASVKICQGGLIISQDDQSKTSMLADGKTKIGLTVTCIQPSGRPLGGVKIVSTIESNDTSSTGILESIGAATGTDGTVKLTYTAPEMDPTSGTRAADIYLTACASVGKPAQTIKASERISLYAGECVYLRIEKPSFETIEKYAAAVKSRNGTIAGKVIAPGDDTDTPVSSAKITVIDQDGKRLAEATTNTDGKFVIKFVGDPTNPSDSKNEIAKPIEVVLNADLANRVKECRKDLDELKDEGYDISSAAGFTDKFIERLARSVPASVSNGASPSQMQTVSDESAPAPKKKKGLFGALDKLSDGVDKLQKKLDKTQGSPGDQLSCTEYLINAYPRLAWSCRYAKLLNERQCESAGWLSENMKSGLGDLMDVFAVTDKIQEVAKDKLKDNFAGSKWEDYKETVLADILDIAYDQFQKGVDMAKTMNYNTDDFDNYKKFGIEWGAKKTAEGVAEGVKLTLWQISRKYTQEMLTNAAGSAERGALPKEDYKPASDKAFDLVTKFEADHNKQNISNCSTEHYRLDTKFIVDTMVKGPLLYFNIKKLAANPETLEKIADLDTQSLEDLQDKFINNGDLASKISGGIDTMFQGYQGYTWLVDYMNAGTVRDEVKKILCQ